MGETPQANEGDAAKDRLTPAQVNPTSRAQDAAEPIGDTAAAIVDAGEAPISEPVSSTESAAEIPAATKRGQNQGSSRGRRIQRGSC